MIRASFNDGWSVRPKVSRHAELQGGGAAWTPVTLPHDALIGTERSAAADPQNAYFGGGTWEYRKVFAVPAADVASTHVLVFEGVYRDAIITVNGAVAGHRPYGYSRFLVPIEHLIRFGAENELVVTARTVDDSRWYTGVGIYRNVWLLSGGPVHFVADRLEVRTPEIDDAGAVVVVAADVRNASHAASTPLLRIELLDALGDVVTSEESPVTLFAGDTLTVRRRLFVADPHRWGLEDPYLYSCRVTLLDVDSVIDSDSAGFGVRSLSLDPHRGFRLNGMSVDLRGACVHHDNGPLGAATIDRADERRVELLKAAGFNAIRSAHNPISSAMLDACDRLGMLVMDETFDMWHEPKSDDDYSLRFAAWWEADVEAMVRKDFNHPSVVFYSIGNEVPDGSTPIGLQTGRALAEKVRSLDETRFVTQAISGMMVGGMELINEFRKSFAARQVDASTGVNTAATSMADIMSEMMKSPVVSAKTAEAFSHLDAAGYNYMSARFEMDVLEHPNRVLFGSETHPTKIGEEWPMVTGSPQIIGDFTWTGWDYLGEVGVGRVEHADDQPERPMSTFQGPYPWLAAWCGDIDITGHRRPQSYYREIVFGLRTDPYIAVARPEHHDRHLAHSSPWSWTDAVSSWSWPAFEGRPVTVEVYADADEVELLVNGRSVGSKPAGAAQRYRTEFELTYEPGEIVAVARRGGTELGRHVLSSASGPTSLQMRVDRPEISAESSDLAYVELTLVDAAGVACHTEQRHLTIEVDGPGVLQGLCSANPKTDENFTSGSCTTFDGRALAVIRPTGPGQIAVNAAAENGERSVVVLQAVDRVAKVYM
ncbi:MAG: glycoside hydrolase family 2 sugar binding [Ilumatobacteraceae bacterium]|nr:glycoside hydrolase family 2 sugar binding [Ilumatobacteraceae bacterium]